MLSLCRNTFSTTYNVILRGNQPFMIFFQEDIRDFRLSKSLVLKYFLQAVKIIGSFAVA